MGQRKVNQNAILWGEGRISRGNWLALRRILQEYDIHTLLEFGSGLSTELFSLVNGLEIVSCDILKWHIDKMQQVVPGVKFIHYEFQDPPKFEGEQFDMVFVDGPQADRSRELMVANRVAKKVLYCHDWGRKQETVKLDDRWEVVAQNRMFVDVSASRV